MTSADGHTGLLGDSSTGTPARGHRFNTKSISFFAYFVASLILLLAIAGKASLLLTDPFIPISLGFSTRGVAWAVVFVELLVLAVCQFILSRYWASILLIVVYLIFSVNGFVSLQEGRQSCGCFGVLEMPIWLSLSISLVSLLLLLFARLVVWRQGEGPDEFTSVGSHVPFRLSLRYYGWGVGVFMSLIVVVLAFESGELLETHPIKAEYNGPLVLNTGVENEIELVLRNRSLHPVRIVGVKSTCNCVAMDALFLEVGGRSSEVLKVRIKPNKAGPFRQQVLFYFGSVGNSRMLVALNGTAIEGAL
jgi:hypothetical protein